MIGSLKLGTATAAPFSVQWNTGYAGDGNYQMQVNAYDASGNLLGSASQSFVINNHGYTLNVTAPNLSNSVSGTVALSITETDPSKFPAMLPIYIDGTQQTIVWTDNDFESTENVTANIDTTQFTNGPHELTMAFSSDDSAKTWYNYRGEYDRVIDIENGHVLMGVAANYLEVYLRPGGTAKLSCSDLFTDATSVSCSAPTYSSSGAPVSVDGSGNVTASSSEGFATITVTDQGKSTTVYVTVRNSFGVPHFASNGQFLNAYTPGQSLFTISIFDTNISLFQQSSSLTASLKAAGINTLSQGIYSNPRNTTQALASWEASFDANYTTSFDWAARNGFSILYTGDDLTREICSDAYWTLNWPSGQQAVQYAFSQAANAGNAIGVDMVDETDALWGPTPRPTVDWSGGGCTMPDTWITTLRSWITAASPTIGISWPNLGVGTVADWTNWDGVGGVADYVTHYHDSLANQRTYNWSAGVVEKNYWMWRLFYQRQPTMMLDRPQLMLVPASGTNYQKESGNGMFYTPPDDVIIQPGGIGPVTSSMMLTAAALGAAGERLYFWETPDDTTRVSDANGTGLQTGTNPVDQDREVSANWNAISNAGNAISLLTPYLLAQPLNSPAYGNNIVTAARQGASGKMLLIVNDNDWYRTIPVDFTAFVGSGSITKYLIGGDLFTTTTLAASSGETITLGPGEAAAYVFNP
jgi:hypothetical protein